jgi:hypothetical protein
MLGRGSLASHSILLVSNLPRSRRCLTGRLGPRSPNCLEGAFSDLRHRDPLPRNPSSASHHRPGPYRVVLLPVIEQDPVPKTGSSDSVLWPSLP